MLDRPEVSSDYPTARLEFSPEQKILCFAPHPDDEVIGCGGLLALAASQGAKVHTIIISAGEQGLRAGQERSNPRINESISAAHTLGLPPPQCWHWPDREVRYGLALIDRLSQAVTSFQPDWVLLPALAEPHPDHQALSLAGMAAVMQCEISCKVLFYEVGAPMVPNTLLDISEVAQAKWDALEAFVSQEENHPYKRHAQAMATLRALGMGPEVKAAEAYWQVDAQTLRHRGPLEGMSFWPLQRQVLSLANVPEQLPLVSVLIRSMDRACLAQAVASVVAQTYPNIEVVVVNATGRTHSPVAHPPQRLSLRVENYVAPTSASNFNPLSRSAAANVAIRSAHGTLALFLDDDDLLLANHVEKLVDALQENAHAVAAYTGVRVEGADGQSIREYDTAWSRQRLLGINFLPIHAVLFRMQPLDGGDSTCFDEMLPVLEDWDFWCQLMQKGDFVHVPNISAVYRQGRGTSHLSDPLHANHWAGWHQRILSRHVERLGLESHLQSLAWHAVTLDQLELKHAALNENIIQVQAQLQYQQAAHILELQQSQAVREKIDGEMARLQVEYTLSLKKNHELDELDKQMQAAIASLQGEILNLKAEITNLQMEHTNSLQKNCKLHEEMQTEMTSLELERDREKNRVAQLEKECDLLRTSIHMLQGSRPVRWARRLRRLFFLGAHKGGA